MLYTKRIVLFLLSYCFHLAEANQGKYIFLLPKTLRPGVDYIISGQNLGTGPINVTTILLGRNGVVLDTHNDALIHTSRIVIKPPPTMVSNNNPRQFQIRIVGTGGANFQKTQYVYFKKENVVILIQTDKKVYKPSQTVKYRVFAINPDLTTYRGKLEVTIEDPRKNKIVNFKRVGDSYGVLEDDFTLTSEPLFGNWKILVKTDTVSEMSTFSIDRYVLPKAEATISLPSYLIITDKSVKVKVAGKYTHGKALSGSVALRLKVDHYHVAYKYVRDNKKRKHIRVAQNTQPTLLYNLTLLNGEASVMLTTDELKSIAYSSSLNSRTLNAQANVTDDETGLVYQSQEVTSKFYFNRETIKFAMNPQNFKPGVNNSYYVEVLDRDGKPLVGKTGDVLITGRYKYQDNMASETTTYPPILGFNRYDGYNRWGRPYSRRPRCRPPSYSWVDIHPQILSLPVNGLLKFDVKIEDSKALELRMTAIYNRDRSVTAKTTLIVTRSPSNTFLSLQLLTLNLKVNDYATFEISSNVAFSSFYYVAIAKGQIQYANRRSNLPAAKSQILKLRIQPNFAPNVRVVVYFQARKKEIVADAITFSVEGLFKNKVSIEFDKMRAEPGDQTKLSIKAAANSNVYALAVDKSTTLIGGATDDMSEEVVNFMSGLDSGSVPEYHHRDSFSLRRGRRSTEVHSRQKRSSPPRPYYHYPIFTPGTDVNDILKYNGLHVITDSLIYKYTPTPTCTLYPFHHHISRGFGGQIYDSPMMARGLPGLQGLPGLSMMSSSNRRRKFKSRATTTTTTTSSPVTTTTAAPDAWESDVMDRSFFPETWIWDTNTTSVDGFANFTLTVPDTITSWMAHAFAVHPSKDYGVGFTESLASLDVYRDFFVTLNLPYSVIRGEEVLIQAIVFNYLNVDIQAIVTLEKPKGYVILKFDQLVYPTESTEDETRIIEVPKGKTASAYFAIKPVELGSLDIQVYAKSSDQQAGDRLTKTLLVESEGVPSEYTETMLINLDGITSDTLEHNFTLSLPSNYIIGSQRLILTAYGDLMASPLNNLDSLVRMPSGCGEQNMVKFVPNIFVRKYLDSIDGLTSEIKAKTDKFMKAGYTRELMYRRIDGSFSAFGDSDRYGSQWLTAYVVHSYISAKPYIYVDDDVIRTAVDFLINNQNEKGTFDEPKRTSSYSFGESTKGIALTAFTVIALADADTVPGISVKESVARAVEVLRAASQSMTSLHDLAITAYAFVRSGHEKYLDDILLKLEALQTTEGPKTFWEVSPVTKNYYSWSPSTKQYNAASIESTAYMLLVYAHRQDILKGLPVMNWLVERQNGNGGYRTTRDTVVALHALSEFAPLVYSGPRNMSLTITDYKNSHTWRITNETTMVQRKVVMTEVTDTVTVTATGQGRAIVSALVKYNVADINSRTPLAATVEVVEETIAILRIQVCTQYTINGSSSSMAIMEVGVISGFALDSDNLASQTEIKRHEFGAESGFRKVIIYLDEITNNSTCIDINMKRQDKVGKVKPAFIKVYDYYNPEDDVTIFYTATNASKTELCDLCIDDCDICNLTTLRKR